MYFFADGPAYREYVSDFRFAKLDFVLHSGAAAQCPLPDRCGRRAMPASCAAADRTGSVWCTLYSLIMWRGVWRIV